MKKELTWWALFFFIALEGFKTRLQMKRILLSAAALIFGVSTFAQQLSPQLLHNNHTPIVKELESVKKTNYNATQQQTIQRNVVWSEDFASGIPATWSFGGYYTNSSSVQIPFPDMTQNPPVYGWQYRGPNTTPDTATGTQGAYGGNAKIESPTMGNGFIIFDSDYLDNAGTQGAFGLGPAPTPHVGTLTTDTIDCSNYPNIQLELNSFQRRFFGQAIVAFSSDGGVSWPDSVELHMLDVNAATDEDNVEKMIVSNFIGGSPTAMIQFIFEGATEGNANGSGYYHWQVDDIILSEIPPYDLVLYGNDFYNDNNDVTNSFYGIELRDYYGQMPLNQADSITFGFFGMNWGYMDQNVTTELNVVDGSGNNIYSNTEAYGSLTSTDTMDFYHAGKFIPTASSEYVATYTISGDSTDATLYDNTLERGFFITDTVFNPYYPNSNSTDVIGTGHFTGGDDGFKLANLVSLIEGDELTSVRIGLNRSNSDYYNTVPGGMVQVSVFDTTGFYSAGVESPILYSDFYFITADDTANYEAIVPIPTTYLGNPQDRNLAPGAYYVAIEMYNNAGNNDIRVRDDEHALRYPWESIIFIPGEQWYTNGNAFNISANFGTWNPSGSSNIEEITNSNVAVYPNPTSGQIKVSFSVNELANTSISIKDITGKTLHHINKGDLTPGVYTEHIDLNNFSKGIYLYELRLNNKASNGKIVLTK